MTEAMRVFALADVPDGQASLVTAETSGWRDDIAVFRDGEEVFAIDDTCPHEEASLSEGWLEDATVECPQHQSKFDLRTGKVLCSPATRDACVHRVEVRDGDVWLTPGPLSGG